MNRNHLVRWTLASLLLVLLLGALPAAAATGTWTAVGSTGVVDESAVGIYSFVSTNLTYLPASPSVAPIVARYNVTKTWSSSDTPPWSVLEMGYFDSSPSTAVQVDFIQVNPCTGTQVVLCSMTSLDAPAATCNRCVFTAPVNFGTNLYYIQVTLSRTTPAVAAPQLLTLKLL
jgi:hypothetical protein